MISNRRRALDAFTNAMRWTRRTLTGALHPWRRRRAQRGLREAPPPSTILLICYGNICRSPYAAGALRRLLPATASVRVDSAGFVGPHRHSPREAVDVAGTRGVDLRRHSSRLASPAAVAGADLVVVMEPDQAGRLGGIAKTKRPVLVLGDLDPDPAANRSIRDPVDQPRQVFAATYDRIDRCLVELVNTIWAGRAG